MPFTLYDDVNMLQASDGKKVGAKGGDDRYILAPNQLSQGQSINIVDTQGSNTLQLTGGLTIASSLVSSTELQLTLSNGASVKVSAANRFNFALGGDPFSATGSAIKTFAQFASSVLGVTALPKTGKVKGLENIQINADGTASSTIFPPSRFETTEKIDLTVSILENISNNPNAANGLRDGVDGNILWSKAKVPSGKKSVDGLLISVNRTQNQQWSTSLYDEKTEISYSFAKAPPKYGPAYDQLTALKASFIPLNDTQKQLARSTLDQWSEIVPLSFAEREEPSSVGDIRWFGSSSGQQIGTATALSPADALTAAAGDIWIGPNYPEQYNNPEPGSYGYQTFLHEIGHILGLIHPQDAATPMDPTHDQLRYTVMSYRDFAGDDLNGYDAKRFFPTTPMLDDIAALQYLYGANWSYKAESNTYSWPADKPVFETIWDGGGVDDTFDGSNQTQAVIFDLNPGQWSTIGKAFWDGQANVRNGLTIAYGVQIENAIGSAYDDQLKGNSLANRFEGGIGNDIIYGFGGVDSAIFSGKQADYQISIDNRKLTVKDKNPQDGDDGEDILFDVEHLVFADGDYWPVLTDNGQTLITQTTLVNQALPTASANGESQRPVFSADGKWLAFQSSANNLTANAKNSYWDVYVQNVETGETQLVSLPLDGSTSNYHSWIVSYDSNGYLTGPATFSADNHWILFWTDADNLLAGDVNSGGDYFLRNLISHQLIMLNSDSNGIQGNKNIGDKPIKFSPNKALADQQWVLFSSYATNLVENNNVTNTKADYFLKNLLTAKTVMLNSSMKGEPGNSAVVDDNTNPAFSSAGDWVMFESQATNLVDNDDNKATDIFIKNPKTGEVKVIDSTINGIVGNKGASEGVFSAQNGDSQWVAFTSDSTNLVANDLNGSSDIFLKNPSTGEIKLANITPKGAQANKDSNSPIFSPDNQWLAFSSQATNLAVGDVNNQSDVFLKELSNGNIIFVNQAANGVFGNNGSKSLKFSDNSQFVLFRSMASNLLADNKDQNNDWDVFVKDLKTGSITMLNSDKDGNQGNGRYYDKDKGDGYDSIVMSPDGQWVAFASDASNLVVGDNNSKKDVFLKNISNGKVLLLNSASDGTQGDISYNDLNAYHIEFSADSHWLKFQSDASNLVKNDSNGQSDVFLKNLDTGETSLLNSNGSVSGNKGSAYGIFSPNGQSIAFMSYAENLLPTDTNLQSDIFIKQVGNNGLSLVSHVGKEIPGDYSYKPILSSDSKWLAFQSGAANLVANDVNQNDDVFVANLDTGEIKVVSSTENGIPSDGINYYNASWLDMNSSKFSADGQWLSFLSNTQNLVPGDDDTITDLFVKNLVTGKIFLVNSNPQQIGNHNIVDDYLSNSLDFSKDGKWLLFKSNASNLVAGDHNDTDVFLKNLSDGSVKLVDSNKNDIAGNGSIAPDDWRSYNSPCVFSPDGKSVLFCSNSSNLVNNDNNKNYDIFLKNLQTGDVQLISKNAIGGTGNGSSYDGLFSADGKSIIFVSDANNLIPDDTNDRIDIFIATIATGEIKKVNVMNNGTEANNDTSQPEISSDGDWVVFTSAANNLIANDHRDTNDIFVRNLKTGEFKLASATVSGVIGNSNSDHPQFLGNSHWLKFNSSSSNFSLKDNNNHDDVFLKNIDTGVLMMLNSAKDGTAGNDYCEDSTFKFSLDMQWVSFVSHASNLVANDVNGHQPDVFLKNLLTGDVQLLNTASDGTPANTDTINKDTGDTEVYFSPDSESVLFTSTAYNLVPGDNNGEIDVFVKQLSTGAIQRLTTIGTSSYDYQDHPCYTNDGQYIIFTDDHNISITPNPYWHSGSLFE